MLRLPKISGSSIVVLLDFIKLAVCVTQQIKFYSMRGGSDIARIKNEFPYLRMYECQDL